MNTPELAQLEMLAQVDDLVERLTRWVEADVPWEPLRTCRSLVRRLLWRVETLRIRLEAPLVVATFGGTGTGKSALVNALVGHEVTESGRQRPTTKKPVLIAHPQTELELLGLPLDQFQVVRVEAPLLRDLVLLDCPDPDTTEVEAAGSNLARLHQLLPFCDVLIYVSTQQKYRSARVSSELAQAATGCRLIFVQTHADIDSDIRDDWRQHLTGEYAISDMFFVDSTRGLREQQAGQKPTGDLNRLQELLTNQLHASMRTQIRRANLVDLVQATLDHCRDQLSQHWPLVSRLDVVLEERQQMLTTEMTAHLREELLVSRNLWERRLLAAVAQNWGFSPFSTVLRFSNGLGTWLASAGMWRARSSAQLALIGALQGARWLNEKQQEISTESRLDRLAALGLDDVLLRESQLIVAGFVHEAQLDPQLVEEGNLDQLRHEAVRVEDQFLGDAGRLADEVIDDLSRTHAGWLVRYWYEFWFLLLVAYVVGRPAYNFFYEHPWLDQPLISTDFYIHALIFVGLWSGVLVMLFTRRLRRGLQRKISELAQRLAETRLSRGLFPRLEAACRDIRQQRERLEALSIATADLRRDIAQSENLSPQISAMKVIRQPALPRPL